MTSFKLITDKCKDCYITVFPKKHLKSITGVKAFIKNTNNNFLLVQRSTTDKYNLLMWEFPGGIIKKFESPLNSLVREVFEETGIKILCSSNNCYVYSDDLNIGLKSIYAGFRRYIFIYSCIVKNDVKIKLSYEHSNYLWCSKKQALSLNLTKDTKEFI